MFLTVTACIFLRFSGKHITDSDIPDGNVPRCETTRQARECPHPKTV